MARTLTESDLRLQGYSEVEKPEGLDTPAWSVWIARGHMGPRTVEARFIYLKSSCNVAQAEDALRHAAGETYVVLPKNRREQLKRIESLAPAGVKVMVLEDMTWDYTKRAFEKYLDGLVSWIPQVSHFVTPRPDNDAKADLGDDIKNWIVTSDATGERQVRVIRAPAGVGKTTVARHLTRQIASAVDRYRKIPIYVEASHWSRLAMESLSSLWITIDQSIRQFDPGLRLDEAMFEQLLQQGAIVFIFDGFDELCGHRLSPLSPTEVLREILEGVASETDARILLTSRTQYWLAEVGDAFPQIEPLDLATFNKQQALDYFQKRFAKDQAKRERATSLFGNLRAENVPKTPGGGQEQIVYHPFVITMVADAVDDEGDDDSLVLDPDAESRSQMLGILRAFCQREVRRRNMVTSADGQIEALQTIAVELFLSGADSFSADDLLIAGFDERDAGLLKDHPLLEVAGDRAFRLRYEFMQPLLVARHLVSAIQQVAASGRPWPDQSLRIADELYSGKNNVLEHIQQLWPEAAAAGIIGEAMKRLPGTNRKCRSLLFHVATRVSDRDRPGLSRAERADDIFTSLGAGTRDASGVLIVSGLPVFGTIANLDLRKTTFRDCYFRDVQFSKCEVDSTTIFDRCTFEGDFAIVGAGQGWQEIVAEHCTFDRTAKVGFDDLTTGGQGRDEAVVRDALTAALQKFWASGRLVETVAVGNWKKGRMGHLQIAARTKEALIRTELITEVSTAGVRDGCLKLDRGAIAEVQQFLDSGHLAGKVKAAYEMLRNGN